MSRNNYYSARNLLNYSCNQKYYTLIGIDLSRQKKNTSISEYINFAGRLEEVNGVKMFFITKKQQKAILNFSLDSLKVTD